MIARIETKKIFSEECEKELNCVFVADVLFDYLIEEEDLRRAASFASHDEQKKKYIVGDIVQHFLSCFGEFIGRKIELREFLESVKCGFIEVEAVDA